jgi:ribosome-associated toxin RatA of RatAB toxin-antitoxin module
MKQVQKSVLVGHSRERMYALVDAVERYPEFLPWCGGAKVHAREAAIVEAEIRIDYRGIRQSFVTRNVNTPFERIDMNFVRGPFRSLAGKWLFSGVGDLGSRIDFQLEWEFASGVLGTLIAPVFDSIADTMVDAFVRRADQIYA